MKTRIGHHIEQNPLELIVFVHGLYSMSRDFLHLIHNFDTTKMSRLGFHLVLMGGGGSLFLLGGYFAFVLSINYLAILESLSFLGSLIAGFSLVSGILLSIGMLFVGELFFLNGLFNFKRTLQGKLY